VEIEVTPSTLKSYSQGKLKPASFENTLIKLPKQQSEWHPIPLSLANFAITGTGSNEPNENSGELATIATVLESTREKSLLTSHFYLSFIGAILISMPK